MSADPDYPTQKSFIESINFPAAEISAASAKEKSGGGRPEFWEMVFWWTRKPLISARAIIAGALLPENTRPDLFKNAIRLDASIAHRQNPSIPKEWYEKYFKGKKLLDPFAGFGNIPLEAMRLGLEKAVAVELLPTAYVFLKAVLEYPLKYGDRLVEDVKKWGHWVIERLSEDPVLQELYDKDVAVFIGTWSVRCPTCARWSPLVGNWWLARTRNQKGGYERLAWMTPRIEGESVKIDIVDLNGLLGKESFDKTMILKVDSKTGTVRLKLTPSESTKLTVALGTDVQVKPIPNGYVEVDVKVPRPRIQVQKETADCFHCGNPMHLIDPQTGRHYADNKGLQTEVKAALRGYVKHALRKFQQGDTSIAKQVLLARVKKTGQDIQFEPATLEDEAKLDLAHKEIEKLLQQGDPDIPKETIAPYGTRFLHPLNYHANAWQDLFNPRQLLMLVKLTKLIREAGKQIEQNKMREGLSQEESRGYAESIVAILSVSLCKFADYDSISTGWHAVLLIARDTLAMRGISMQWNWCDVNPIAETAGSWVKSLSSVVVGIEYLVSALSLNNLKNQLERFGSVGSQSSAKALAQLNVLLADASVLNLDEKFGVIITDPPYYHDVPYSEISDFYYVWLKRALSDIQEGRLTPRFLAEAFFKKVGGKWVEVGTQWKEYGDREVSVKLASKSIMEQGRKHFLELLGLSFQNCKLHLIDRGILATYYAHTDPDAWQALLEAGWIGSGFRVSNAFPIATESPERRIARGKLSLDTSIVVVWRKGTSGIANVSDLYNDAIQLAKDRASQLIKRGCVGSDLLVGTLAAVLSSFTKYKQLYGPSGELGLDVLLSYHVYPLTARAIAVAISREAGAAGEVRSPEALFYLLAKVLFGKIAVTGRKSFDRSNLAILTIATRTDSKNLVEKSIVARPKGLSKGEGFVLFDPLATRHRDLEEFLQERGLNPRDPEPRNAVDALHILEYWGSTLSAKQFTEKYAELTNGHVSLVDEARILAIVLSKVLPDTDAEKELCKQAVEKIYGASLERYV